MVPRPAQVELLGAFALGGSTQYAITLNGTRLVGNEVNATAVLAAQDNLDVTLRVLGSGEPRCTRCNRRAASEQPTQPATPQPCGPAVDPLT